METSTHLGVSNKGRTLFLQIHHISIYIYIYVQFDVYTRVLNPDMNNLRSWCIHFIGGQEKILFQVHNRIFILNTTNTNMFSYGNKYSFVFPEYKCTAFVCKSCSY